MGRRALRPDRDRQLAIGIRQELKAKETLDQLALLVAPRAKAIRDGRVVELTADEVVPGDLVRVEPGDQLVADGAVVDTRGLTVDESLLTGESDGIRKRVGDRLLSGSFGISGSGHYEVDAVREDSYAAKIAGEAREFRHAPSPLQVEVNTVLKATTIALVPIALIVLIGFTLHDKAFREAAQEATAGLVTLIPEGLVLLMSVTLAVAAVRLARQNTLVQQMAATEALAAVDTICVDKTGTLTDGDPEAGRGRGRRPGPRRRPPSARSAPSPPRPGERNRTLETIAERYPAHPERPSAEVPFSSQWKWSGLTLNGSSYVIGAPDVLAGAGALRLPEGLQRALDEHTGAGRRVVAFGEARGGAARRPGHRAAAAARAAGAGRARGDAAPRRRRDDRLHARPAGRPEADLRRRARDGDRGRARGRRARRRRGDRGLASCPTTRAGSPRPRSATRSSAGSRRSRRRRWSGRSPTAAASRR